MGADLCGHIMVGPKKISQEAVDRAIRIAESLTTECMKAIKENKPVAADTGSYYYYDTPSHGRIDTHIAEEIADLSPSSIEGYIRAFVNIWNTEDSRDLMARMMPGSNDKKIVVCGDRTWGDGPQEESTWWYANLIGDKLGVFGELGIE